MRVSILLPTFRGNYDSTLLGITNHISKENRISNKSLINQQDCNKFIITHGTDTMMETANYISERITDKLIVITGAMRPEQFTNSDAAINLGCAITTANLMHKGVFIAMHGIVKLHSEMKRDLKSGKYY